MTISALVRITALLSDDFKYPPAFADELARAVLEELESTDEQKQLRTDAERLDWMIAHSAQVIHSMDGDACWCEYEGPELDGRGYVRVRTDGTANARAEIDKARGA